MTCSNSAWGAANSRFSTWSTFRGFFVLAMSIQTRPGLPGKTPLTARIDGTANRQICRSTSPRHRDYTSGCVRFIWQPDWYRRRLLRSMFFIPERTKNLATPETNRSCIWLPEGRFYYAKPMGYRALSRNYGNNLNFFRILQTRQTRSPTKFLCTRILSAS